MEDLKEPFRSQFRAAMKEVNKDGELVFLVEGIRSIELQKQYYKTGKSQTMNSNHLNGLAADIAFRGPSLYPTDAKVRDKVYDIFNKYGIVSGYRDLVWNFDRPHLQWVDCQKPQGGAITPGYTKALVAVHNVPENVDLIKEVIAKNSSLRDLTKNEELKKRLNEMNKFLRGLVG